MKTVTIAITSKTTSKALQAIEHFNSALGLTGPTAETLESILAICIECAAENGWFEQYVEVGRHMRRLMKERHPEKVAHLS
jgi:hypothetical protein